MYVGTVDNLADPHSKAVSRPVYKLMNDEVQAHQVSQGRLIKVRNPTNRGRAWVGAPPYKGLCHWQVLVLVLASRCMYVL